MTTYIVKYNPVIKPIAHAARTAITKTDIANYRGMIDSGNVDGFYNALKDKGFDSAYWARDEFNKGTDYGATNSIFWQNQMRDSAQV